MQKIFKKQSLIFVFNAICILSIMIFLFVNNQNAYIRTDDMHDLILRYSKFAHCRIFSESIELFFVKQLPEMLNIHIQDFAIISEGILKIALFVPLIYVISTFFFYFKKRKNCFLGIIFLLVFFTYLCLIEEIKFLYWWDTLQFFFGYTVPILFFLLWWKSFSDMYIKNGKPTQKDDLKLIVLTLFTAFSNEQVCTIMVILMFFTLVESFFFYKKDENSIFMLKKLCILIPISMSYYLLSICTFHKTSVVQHSVSGFISTYGDIAEYFNLFKHIFFEENIYLWLFIVFLIVIICIKEKFLSFKLNNNVFKFILYSYLSCFIFYISLYYLGQTYHHPVEIEDMIYPKYWLLYPAFKIFLKMFLLSSIFYLLSYIFSRKDINIFCKNMLLFVVIMSLFIYVYKNYKYYNIFYTPDGRKTLYLMDKLTVFYANKKMPVVYPYENIQFVWFFQEETMPEDIRNKKFGKVYHDCTYLKYVAQVYNVDISNGMMFKPYDEAMQDFITAGGVLDEKELQELKFSKIKK